MLTEGIVALIWAAPMVFFENVEGLKKQDVKYKYVQMEKMGIWFRLEF